VLDAMLAQFPFRIRGFHSDNGSEFINHTVAQLLNKLLIEQTKSRPRHSSDNGLVEAKNGAVVRKHMGYTHIAGPHAAAIETFYEQHFNPYLNFHRPCGVPEQVIDAKGKMRRVSVVCDPLGDFAATSGTGWSHERRSDGSRAGAKGGKPNGHAGSGRDAKSQGKALCMPSSKADGVSEQPSLCLPLVGAAITSKAENQSQNQNLPKKENKGIDR
jgi:hypothetical protein